MAKRKPTPAPADPAATPLSALKLNDGTHGLPKNPRFIKDDRFRALCDSVRDNPEFMTLRPIITDENGVILCGDKRFRACRELKIDPLPAGWVKMAAGLPVAKKRRLIILDNRGFGEDDYDLLANEWNVEELLAAGLTEQDLSGFNPAAEKMQSEPAYTTEDTKADRRAAKIAERLTALAKNHKPKLETSAAIILSAESSEFICLEDGALPDFLAELRRYQENGESSPLAAILERTHKL